VRTDPFRFAERHRAICERAEREFLEQRRKTPKFTAGLAVKGYAVAVRCAVARRDGTDLAGILAAKAAHVASKFGPPKKPSGNARRQKKQRAQKVESERPTRSLLPTFRPHAGA
jgi:hypothetical protein